VINTRYTNSEHFHSRSLGVSISTSEEDCFGLSIDTWFLLLHRSKSSGIVNHVQVSVPLLKSKVHTGNTAKGKCLGKSFHLLDVIREISHVEVLIEHI